MFLMFSLVLVQVGAAPRDVVGAAQTGSGKTLAYGLPIVDWLLRRHKISGDTDVEEEVKEQEEHGQGSADDDDESQLTKKMKKGMSRVASTAAAASTTTTSAAARGARDGRALIALVLCPTRELALQVSDHLTRLVEPSTLAALARACDAVISSSSSRNGNSSTQNGGGVGGGVGGYKLVCTLVGGLSEQKQIRLLDRRPPIVVRACVGEKVYTHSCIDLHFYHSSFFLFFAQVISSHPHEGHLSTCSNDFRAMAQVATPGRCWEMLAEVGHSHLQAGLRYLRFLVVDEADRMMQVRVLY